MKPYSLSRLSDHVLLHDLATLVAQDRHTTAAMLAHLAEVDARKLYLPAAYPSMYAYCVGELRLSEDAAAKRIQAARTARRFPTILMALADGRLHLAAMCLLAPHLTHENAGELIEAATHKTKAEVELLLAQRFPRPDLIACIRPVEPVLCSASQGNVCESELQHAPGHVESGGLGAATQLAEIARELPPAPRARLTPLAPQRFAMQLTVGAETHEKLRYAQALLGHVVPSGDLSEIVDRALDALIARLEQRRFAAATRTRTGRRSRNARYVPSHVRRTVWRRDGGQCTFVGDNGRRCAERTRLEFDHVDPVARGGGSSPDRVRLRCRAHNQYEAERVYGEAFMRGKRERSRESVARKRDAATKKSETTGVEPGRRLPGAHAD